MTEQARESSDENISPRPEGEEFDLSRFVRTDVAQANLRVVAGALDQPLLAEIIDAVLASPSPDDTLNNFERFVVAAGDPAEMSGILSSSPTAMKVLSALFGYSQFLSNVLVRDPEILQWLIRSDVIDLQFSLTDFRRGATSAAAGAENILTAKDALSRWRRRQLLRIGARDIMQLATVEQTTREISDLAQAIIEKASEWAWKENVARFGTPVPEGAETGEGAGMPHVSGMCVIGMGKLGGRELNFSSDIDLVFIYDAEGETTGIEKDGRHQQRQTNHVFFTRMGETLLKFLSERTTEGNLFRVDMRLRPEGQQGPLVRSLESFISYLKEQARDWERLAYLKARVLAGPTQLADRIYRVTEEFVFSEASPQRIVREVEDLKVLIDREVAGSDIYYREVKRGYGGIREIEFVVAAMQIIYGKTHRALHVRNIFLAVQRLKEVNLFTLDEMAFYLYAYEFLRMVEHRLQMAEEHQTHTLPLPGPALEVLARRAHFHDAAAFETAYRKVTDGVHERFIRFFKQDVEQVEQTSRDILVILDRNTSAEDAQRALARYGIHDPQAAPLLRDLALGTREIFISAEGQRSFEQMLPSLLRMIGQAPRPVRVLPHFHSFVLSIKGITYYYEVIAKHPEILNLLVRLFGTSDVLSLSIISYPEFFDALIGSHILQEFGGAEEQNGRVRAAIGGSRVMEKKLFFLRRAAQFENLIIALRRLAGIEQLRRTLRLLSATADTFVAVAVELACLRMAEKIVDDPALAGTTAAEIQSIAKRAFSIIALGKYGGNELNFFGDLDVVFLYDDSAEVPEPYSGRLGEGTPFFSLLADNIMHVLGDQMRGGRAYVFDARLRPHGKNSPLVTATSVYRDYLASEAQVWEIQAFQRARHVWGNPAFVPGLSESATARAQTIRDSARNEVAAMRRRLEESVSDSATLDFKRTPGGLTDIEFLIQYKELRHAGTHIGSANYFENLESADSQDFFGAENQATLIRSYAFFRTLESNTRLVTGKGESQLPQDPDEFRAVARLMELDVEQFPDVLEQTQTEVRVIWDHHMHGNNSH